VVVVSARKPKEPPPVGGGSQSGHGPVNVLFIPLRVPPFGRP
jgi:hypothetical protein